MTWSFMCLFPAAGFGTSDVWTGLRQLGERLSPEAALHIEFKIDSIAHLKRSPVSIFSHDLVSGHKIVLGSEALFEECQDHLDSTAIPLSEASRLLLNRCSGILLAQEILSHSGLNQLSTQGIHPLNWFRTVLRT